MKAKQREWIILSVGAVALVTSLLLYFLQDPLSGMAWIKNALLALAFALYVGYHWLALRDLKQEVAALEATQQDLEQKLAQAQKEKAAAEKARQETQQQYDEAQKGREEAEKQLKTLEKKVKKLEQEASEN